MNMKGFTLIEAMIAVTIVTFAVAGPLVTASRAIVAAKIAHDQLVASYLAQEGVEYIHLMRDDEYLAAYQAGGTSISTAAWNNFISGSDAASITQCRAPSVCTLDPTRTMGTGSGLSLALCSGTCAALFVNSNGLYNQQSSGTRTPYTRSIQAIDVSATDERIISTVSWSDHSIPYSVTVTDHLTPWQ